MKQRGTKKWLQSTDNKKMTKVWFPFIENLVEQNYNNSSYLISDYKCFVFTLDTKSFKKSKPGFKSQSIPRQFKF